MKKVIFILILINLLIVVNLRANGKTFKIPAEKPVSIGDYSFQIVGGGGNFLLSTSYKSYKKIVPFQLNKKIMFPLGENSVEVIPQYFCELPPVHMIAKIKFVKRQLPDGCSIKESNFLGKKSIIMENSLIYLVILPDIGGRIIDMGLQADKENYFFNDRRIISSYKYTQAWQDIGGLEDNLGGWAGPLWNKKYSYKILKNTPDEASISLFTETEDIKFEREMTIKRKSTEINVKSKWSSLIQEQKFKYGIGIHPEFSVGGQADISDIFFWKENGKNTETHSYTGNGQVFSVGKFSGYSGITDTKSTHSVIFKFKNPCSVAFYQGSNYYNLELSRKPTEEVDKFEMDYNIILLHNLRKIVFFLSPIAGNLKLDKSVIKNDEKINIQLNLVPCFEFKGKLNFIQGNYPLASKEINLFPLKRYSFNYQYVPQNLKDGKYPLTFSFQNSQIKENFTFFINVIGQQYKEMEKELKKIEEEIKKLCKDNSIEAYFYLEKARSACEKGEKIEFEKYINKIERIIRDEK